MKHLALLALLVLTLNACVTVPAAEGLGPRFRVPDGTLKSGARLCGKHGYSYVVRTGPLEVYCLKTNTADEPEALLVADVLRQRGAKRD